MMIALLLLAATLVREEQTITVNGVPEVWRLQWKSPPQPACDAKDQSWMNCPCEGFAYGESGSLDLVRLRQGREVERLPLSPLFDGPAMLQRWPTTDKDLVAKRPVVRLMNFADYDHNGAATEFYLQTSSGPCGHIQGVVIGVSSSNSRLHVFGSSLHPDKALVLQRREWDDLLNARGPVRVVDWFCGDHGQNKQIELRLQATPAGIEVIREVYPCPRKVASAPDGPNSKLICTLVHTQRGIVSL